MVHMERTEHWDRIWSAKAPDQVSWHEAEPRLSLELIQATGVGLDAPIVDVGGGASVLVDRLVSLGHRRVSVVDISGSGLERARDRLGDLAASVSWVTADVRQLRLEAPVRVWHDRAVFHFLVAPPDQEAYLESMTRSLEPEGYAILATFALDGPTKCSGLPVARHSGDTLAERLGPGFELLRTARHCHRTPNDVDQWFTYALFRRR
jgi:ubiquinone/menaquinone biosynthesis C-methylase UbiE